MNQINIKKGITDYHLSTIYENEYVAKAFKQDGRAFEPIHHQLAEYYSCFIDGKFAGAFLMIRFSLYEIELHSLLLKDAIFHSRKFGVKIIEESFSIEQVLRITAPILSDLKKAQNYVKRLGFCLEGIKKNATIRNGKKIDSFIFGMTKEDYERSR